MLTGFYFLPLPPLPDPKSAKEAATRTGKHKHARLFLLLAPPPKLSINADTDVLCVSKDVKGCSGQRMEALRATQHAEQAWTTTPQETDLACA